MAPSMKKVGAQLSKVPVWAYVAVALLATLAYAMHKRREAAEDGASETSAGPYEPFGARRRVLMKKNSRRKRRGRRY